MLLDAPVARIADLIKSRPADGTRRLIALVGPPASGKSTLAQALAAALPKTAVVPMDGFHLDNSLLDLRGLRARKGSPDSFDVDGFLHLIRRLKAEDDIIYPLFDRETDTSVAGAGQIGPDTDTIIVEGNYLLLDRPGWRDLAPLWDLSVYLSVPEDMLRARLMQRWYDHGFDDSVAAEKTDGNDLPNAREVARNLIRPDITIENPDAS